MKALPVHGAVPLEGEHAEAARVWPRHSGASPGTPGVTVAPLALHVAAPVVRASAAPGDAVVVSSGALGVLHT